MAVKALSFDLYNTLLEIKTEDESPETFNVFTRYLHSLNIELQPDSLRQTYLLCLGEAVSSLPLGRELDSKQVFRKIFSRHHIPVTADRWDHILYQFRVASRRKLRLAPATRDLLKDLKTRFRLFIVSDAQAAFTRPELEMFGLPKLFERIILSQESGNKKATGRLFTELISGARLAPDELIHFGDDETSDGVGAVVAGIRYVHVDAHNLPDQVRTVV